MPGAAGGVRWCPVWGAGVLLVVGWLWVEMCIVDASILFVAECFFVRVLLCARC